MASEVALRAARDEAMADLARHADDQWFAFLVGLVKQGVDQGCLDRSFNPKG